MLPNIFVSSLAQTLSVGGNDTSIQLSTIYTQDGQVVATADFATFGRGIITVNPTSFSNAEFISFTGITPGTSPAGTLTGTLRGLSFKGNTQIAANQKFNVVGTPVIISFGTHNIQDLVTYINNIAIAGAPNASTTVKGITTLSVAPVLATNPIAVGTNDTRIPSTNTAAALVGSQSIPSATNLFITQDNVYDNIYEQQQTTQNSTIDFGDSNTTGNKNVIAQKFYPAKTKIRGVHLYKSADTGTFTGTVTVLLVGDTGGTPNTFASPLATMTLTNAQWLALPVGEFEAVFGTEYASQVVGNAYWIGITTSTSDSSNHPNLGINTAGGYTNGVVKYYNATDGWVTVSNIDLYFKTLEGINSQVVETSSSGKIPSTLVDNTTIPSLNRTQWDWYGIGTTDVMISGGVNKNGQFLMGYNFSGGTGTIYVGTPNAYGNYSYISFSIIYGSYTSADVSWFGNNILVTYQLPGFPYQLVYQIFSSTGSVLYTSSTVLIGSTMSTFGGSVGVSSDGINGMAYIYAIFPSFVYKVFTVTIAGSTATLANTYTITTAPTTSGDGVKPYTLVKYSTSNIILINNLAINFVTNTVINSSSLSGFQGGIGATWVNPLPYLLDTTQMVVKNTRAYYGGSTAYNYAQNFQIIALPTGLGI